MCVGVVWYVPGGLAVMTGIWRDGHRQNPEADVDPRVLLNTSASPGGGLTPPPPHSDPLPLLSDWADFSAGLRPITNFFWHLRRKSV